MVSFISAILIFICFFVYLVSLAYIALIFLMVLILSSIIFGVVALIKISRNGTLKGRLFAWFGVVVGVLWIIIGNILSKPIYYLK